MLKVAYASMILVSGRKRRLDATSEQPAGRTATSVAGTYDRIEKSQKLGFEKPQSRAYWVRPSYDSKSFARRRYVSASLRSKPKWVPTASCWAC